MVGVDTIDCSRRTFSLLQYYFNSIVTVVSMYSSTWFASCFIKCKQSLRFASIALRYKTMFCTCTCVASWLDEIKSNKPLLIIFVFIF